MTELANRIGDVRASAAVVAKACEIYPGRPPKAEPTYLDILPWLAVCSPSQVTDLLRSIPQKDAVLLARLILIEEGHYPLRAALHLSVFRLAATLVVAELTRLEEATREGTND